ncbi:MAG: DUF134 domain-containing protein [Lachnospiraceae bacterium]|nr:DUF134 domain-containing protein [Lachnospiraceae bacterium]
MSRIKRCRRIVGYPEFWSFLPEAKNDCETIDFMLDEFETIRLIDYEKCTQEEAAGLMGVSRATVTGIYENARYKIADAMINGKRIRITGGYYKIDSIPASSEIKEKGENIMRVAVTYEEGMVGQHFGRTEEFKIYEVSDGKIVSSQIINTNGNGHGALAGFLRAGEVEVLICGGIGMGARNALSELGIKLLPGVKGKADDVMNDYLSGDLDYDPDTACDHHDHEEGHDCHHGDCGSHGCH